jgi:hypothetical protein
MLVVNLACAFYNSGSMFGSGAGCVRFARLLTLEDSVAHYFRNGNGAGLLAVAFYQLVYVV